MGYRLPLELLLCGGVFLFYRYIRTITRDDGREAFANARHVMRIEQMLGIFNEPHVQGVFLAQPGRHPRPEPVLRHRPLHCHGIGFLAWAYVRHNRIYSAIRNVFLTVTGAALVIHVLVPLAPPRMFPGNGFVDTLRLYGPRIYTTDLSQSVANQFAAVPSLHFGWAVLVAGGVIAIKRNKWSLLTILHPVITLLAIVATGNHYWFDAMVAMALIMLAVIGLLAYQRRQTIRVRAAAAVRFIRLARV
ncbi:MAG: phosphatase PAP2 family protein [Ilumatobacteraceae bacterium]